ncbi:MAG: hypothetical protein SGBAC_001618 [Bacillariaceae sp.]
MTNTGKLEQQKALADAVSGVAGSLVSLWTFYPIEVIKSNLQAGSSQVGKNRSLFQGCRSKTLHTATSSFCYFFFYSLIFNKWKNRHNIPKHKINPATRLFLSAVAAMMNTLITLPLDVLSSKQVTEVEDDFTVQDDAMDEVWEQLTENGENESLSEFKDSSMIEDSDNDSDMHQEEATLVEGSSASVDQRQSQPLQSFPSFESLDMSAVFKKYYERKDLNDFKGLWKGLVPALLLCSNPSIHYTTFDLTKARILARRKQEGYKLSMLESFLIGLFSKFVATILTYPLIRAKVILMVTSETSLLKTLQNSYKQEGMSGVYKGCDWQLLHTVLKSALMMMVRERITDSSRRMIVGKEPSNQ